ncbi:MAG: xanthine dehydrogenase small subunit [Gammaproteobacteria bacterium]|nr:xanthine dehydrogenase small subunit [Gammaproteobacteria bacterium]NNM20650.1 xanthine dehydrogenase small subunit [Gammaproteobacteria bacterium]
MHQQARNSIRFLLDGEVIQLRDFDPNRTVLQWLREDRRRTGAKEGCAEGDCGACAVVVAELDNNGSGLRYQAINSCIQFLATLDGKALLTTESLSESDGSLHPVQQAMVDEHGSQCGFCTPGFVMSLYALYEENSSPGRVEIDDALAGNLCRCTGYRPIVAAARAMYKLPRPDRDEKTLVTALQGLQHAPVELAAAGHSYFAPTTLAELAALVAEHPEAQLLAGGTDVGLWVTKEHRELPQLIYLGQVRELQQINKSQMHLELGAAVTFSDAMPALLEIYPALDELLRRFAGPPIRNAATVGGNIANGSPIGDSMPALIALGAVLVLRRGETTREVAIDQFYPGFRQTDLQPGEFLERIRIPMPRPQQQFRAYKVSKRFDQDISAVCAAFSIDIVDGVISEARFGFGGVAAIPSRAPAAEQALTGSALTQATAENGVQALARDFSPITDMRASAGYRLQVCQNLLLKFLHETAGEVEQRLYNYGR